MDKRQDIGAAFKQRLQDLNQGPSDSAALWDQITAQLDAEGTQPKGIPLWMKSGLAVLVVGLISLGIWQFTSGPSASEQAAPLTETTNSDALNSENQEVNTNPEGNTGPGGQENAIVAADGNSADTSSGDISTQDNVVASETTTSDAQTTDGKSLNVSSESVTLENTTATSTATAVATEQGSAANSATKTNTAISTEGVNSQSGVSTSGVAQSSTSGVNNTTGAQQQGQFSNPSTVTANTLGSSSTVSNVGGDSNLPSRGFYVWPKNTVRQAGFENNSYPLVYDIDAAEKAKELPAIEYRSGKKKKSKEMRALERALKREEAINYKWSVGAIIAPTTYGSLSKGSMLDSRLENNPREGETNLSYGLQIKNQMNQKSALRFGINRVNVGYNTQNFQVNVIGGVVNIYQLTGIDPGAEIQEGGISLDPRATEFFESNDVVTIDQDISYLEIPLEYQYTFINNRFGANLIGGASLMVLDDNRIFAVSESGQSIPVGSSSNLTNLGYTVNLGLGLKYDISKHFQLNLDPMLKIQMNSPANSSTNNFRPYYFGIFSGLHFKF